MKQHFGTMKRVPLFLKLKLLEYLHINWQKNIQKIWKKIYMQTLLVKQNGGEKSAKSKKKGKND